MKNKRSLAAGIIILLAAAIAIYALSTGKAAVNTFGKLKMESKDGLLAIGDDVFVSADPEGTVNMTLFVSQGKGTLIDAGFNEKQAKVLQDYIDKNKIELQNIIITHTHEDHIKYLEQFKKEGVEVFGPENTENGQVIVCGADELRILDTPGHASDNHISVEIVKHGVLAAGDVVTTSFVPSMGYGSSTEALINTLETIKGKKYALIIPGHGMPMSGKAAIELNLGYIEKLKKSVVKALQEGTAVQKIDIPLQSVVDDDAIISAKGADAVNKNNIREMYYLLKNANK
ncbi:MAG: beta-lactamase domain protein [Clostridia bacterium]|jgi:glyoxylase-like metal-dependent hydrolase (beta-lactamase superfamily II)|nr:beta-lactamase domain protein [Clostridia bacterium]